MAIKALWRIKADKVYEPGETIAGLSPADEKRLITLGAAQPIVAAPPVNEERSAVEGLRGVLKKMTKKELRAYAEQAGVEVPEKTKPDEIISRIIQDAEEKGVDIEALTDEQLRAFAGAVGIEATEDMDRDDLIDAVEARFGEVEDA